jgi:hypothetical protein
MTFEYDNMPIMSPVIIDTKGHGLIRALLCWVITSRKWKIEDDWLYYIDGVQHVVESGFVFDGASVPKYFRSWLSPMGILLIPGLVHDWGYYYASLTVVGVDSEPNVNVDKTQKEMDIIFRDIAIQVNGFRYINKVAYYVLRLCGFFAWNGHRRREKKELDQES